MTTERLELAANGTILVGERRPGPGPTVVLLHAGVTDRRGWQAVVGLLSPDVDVIAYDRRGHGETPPSAVPFSHVDDLLALLDGLSCDAVWLVGSSMGGGLAIDAALVAPDRVAGLVLIAPSVAGAPDPDTVTPEEQRLDEAIEHAAELGDIDQVNRLEAWLWLDGPAAAEGRVGGDARALALAMNEVILGHQPIDHDGASGIDAWSRLGEVRRPAVVISGDLDIPCIVSESRGVSGRLPSARFVSLPGTAHLPYLESPALVADVIREALSAASAPC
jgi:pimeloyl-ACP methyl ester carboxylesterase